MPFRRFTSSLAVLMFVVSGCGEDVGGLVNPLPPAPPISSGTYFLHTADSSTLPALISERIVWVALEETFLDSAQLTVDAGAGTWEQRYWLRIFITGVEDRREVVIDLGEYTVSTSTANFTFGSSVRDRTFAVASNSATQFTTSERMVFYANAPTITGVYRTTRP